MTNPFSSNDPNLPRLDLALPKIKKSLPKIQMKNSDNLFFEIDGKNVSMDTVADKFSNLFFND